MHFFQTDAAYSNCIPPLTLWRQEGSHSNADIHMSCPPKVWHTLKVLSLRRQLPNSNDKTES
eukprot:5122818-Amphidinium_carterae.1